MDSSLMAPANNSVLVIGGGIAGIGAALDLSAAGRKVYLIDRAPAPGGLLPLLDRQFPTNDCQICFLSPGLVPGGAGRDIEVMPLTNLEALEGQAGDFTARLRVEPRYIDVERCTACGDCQQAAPEGAVRFTPGLDLRSPTCLRYPQATPMAFSIDRDLAGDDLSWAKACPADAIDFDQKVQTISLQVGSVVLATGAEVFDPTPLQQWLGYGLLPDVVTSLEFERILSATGPTGGAFTRPSDGKKPKRIGWIQCVGSRTTSGPGVPYCSSICCMFAMKEAAWAKEHFADDLEATVFFMDMRPMGKDYEQYYQRMKNELGVNFVRCRPHTVTHDEASGELELTYADQAGELTDTRLDMVVLATGLCAPKGAAELAAALGIEQDPHGFAGAHDFSPVSTSRPGVYACGMALGPRDIPDSLMQASAAACRAGLDLAMAQAPDRPADVPPERDVSGEAPKVGVFMADFGGNVAKVVDIPAVLEHVSARPEVVRAEELPRADAEGALLKAIADDGINRVVLAGSSPRGQESRFKHLMRRAGLNPGYLEMANILEQDAWVHPDPAVATEKAKDLVRMALGGVLRSEPIYSHREPLNSDSLVVGGGVAGMTAALSLADAGLGRVTLVERAKELGGLAARLGRSLDGSPVRPAVEDLVARVQEHPAIDVITDALVVDHDGQMGAFTTGVQSGPGLYYRSIEHGVAVIATGAQELRPTGRYLYGEEPKVMTQLELEKVLERGDGSDADLNTVVMIQCVGSREPANPACGRICCRSAVKNALWLQELNPSAKIYVLYRDMRMPYTAEDAYRQAREQGVIFVRYEPENPPRAYHDEDGLAVSFTDPVLDKRLAVNPDALVLSTPQVAPDEASEELAEIFRLQRDDMGYLREEHPKLKPVDSPVPGVFLAGSVRAPASLNEAQTQGLAAAGRAVTVLSHASLAAEGGVARVKAELCAACLVCVRACPFGVPFIGAEGTSQIDPASCQGCGVCAAECPAGAITLAGYPVGSIEGRTDALLEGVM